MHRLAERSRDRERVEVDAERDPAELGVVAAADTGRQLGHQRPLSAEEELGRRRAGDDSDGRGGRGCGLDRSADVGRLELGGPELHERNPEGGRWGLLAVGDGQRHEAPVDGEAVDGDERPLDELLHEAVVALRLRERGCRAGRHRRPVERQPDGPLAGAVGRLDHDRIAELVRRRRNLVGRAADARARLREPGGGEALTLPLPRHRECRRIRRERMREAEPRRDARPDRDGVVAAGRDDAVGRLRAGEAVDRRLVLDRHDRTFDGHCAGSRYARLPSSRSSAILFAR